MVKKGMEKREIRGVLFDLDGTLLDTLGDIADTMTELTDKYGLPPRSEGEYALLVGRGAARLINDVFPDTMDRESILGEYKFRLGANSFGRTKPYGGIPLLLDYLRSRSLPLAVFTNKPQDMAIDVCHHYFGEGLFTHIRGERPDRPAKPDPSQGWEIVADWGISPGECLFLGDTSTDMETAVRGKFLPLGCTWGFRGREELIRTGARWLSDTPEGVISLFDESRDGRIFLK